MQSLYDMFTNCILELFAMLTSSLESCLNYGLLWVFLNQFRGARWTLNVAYALGHQSQSSEI